MQEMGRRKEHASCNIRLRSCSNRGKLSLAANAQVLPSSVVDAGTEPMTSLIHHVTGPSNTDKRVST